MYLDEMTGCKCIVRDKEAGIYILLNFTTVMA